MARHREALAYAALPALFLALFLGLPLVTFLAYGLGGDGADRMAFRKILEDPGSAIRRLLATGATVLGTPYYQNRILFTLKLAGATTICTLLAGVPLAYVFSHYAFPGRRFLRALFTVPFILPAIVVALALHTLLGPRGVLGVDLLRPLGNFGSLLVAHVFYNASLVMRLVGNHWERVGPVYVEAARTLGANPRAAFWRVELNLIRPALVASGLLVFVFSLTTFAIVRLLPPVPDRVGTIETLIQEETSGFLAHYDVAAVLSLLQILITYPALLLFIRLQRRSRLALVPRTATHRRPLPAWGWAVLLMAGAFLAGPLAALVGVSFLSPHGWTVDSYADVLTGRANLGPASLGDAILNSLIYGAGALAIALAMAFLASVAMQRAGRAAWAEGLLLLPLGVSSVVVGLGLLLTWDGRVLPDLRASPWRIVLAHALIAFPLASRILSPTIEGIEPRLREAARTLGAGPLAVLARLELPLAYPALGVAAVYAFGASLGEFGATTLLRRPETTTIPLAIFDAYSKGFDPFVQYARILAVLLILVSLVGFLLLERLRIRTWGEFA